MSESKSGNKKTYMRRLGLRVLPAVIATIFLTLIVLALFFVFGYVNSMRNITKELTANLQTAINQIEMQQYDEQMREQAKQLFDRFCADYVLTDLKNGVNDLKEAVESVNDMVNQNYCYELYSLSGEQLTADEYCKSVNLSAEDKKQLFTGNGGELYVDECHFITMRLDEGYLLYSAVHPTIRNKISDVLSANEKGITLVLTPEGEFDYDLNVIAAEISYNEETLKNFMRSVDTDEVQYDAENDLLFMTGPTESGNVVVAGVNFNRVMAETLESIAVICAMFVIAVVILLLYALKLSRSRDRQGKRGKLLRIGRKMALDRAVISHITALLVFSMLLTYALNGYMDTMYFMSSFSMYVSDDETMTGNLLKAYQSENEEMIAEYSRQSETIAGLICWSTESVGGALSSEKLQSIRNRYNNIREICLYNSDGYLIASDTGYSGYRLEYIEGQPETECLKLLSGDKDVLITELPDKDERYVAVRRKDGNGIVRILMNQDEWLFGRASVYEYFSGALSFFGRGNKYYCYKQDTNELSMEPISAEVVSRDPVKVSKSLLEDGQFSFAYIDGQLQYMHVREYSSDYIVRSTSVSDFILQKVLPVFVIELAGYVLLWIVMVSTNGIFRLTDKEPDEEMLDSIVSMAVDKDKQLSVHFSKAIKMLVNLLLMSIIVLIVLEYSISGSYSLASFLMSSDWKRGVNIFSLTNVFGLIIVEQLVSRLVSSLILLIANNMNAKGRTIGRMLASMMRFLMMIALIFYSLILFGVNVTTLMTGAGIVGAALSFCAQSTVSDIISGLFIIFEGHIRVGDWVLLDGESGEVYEIGIRTSVIAKSGAYVMVNNSKMNNLKKLDPLRSGPGIEVSVGYGEDLDHVIRTIEENRELYRKEIPCLTSGPFVAGVNDLGDSGVSIFIYAKSAVDKTAQAERGMRRVTHKLFAMQNIEIPWPQVVVHNSEPVLHNSGANSAENKPEETQE